jgi:NNP family nitrate/nitrite transporter-like MFS transporter
LARIAGGKLSDRFGGGRVALTVFIGAIVAGGCLAVISTYDDLTHGSGAPATGLTMVGYIIFFIVLFIFCGAGKGPVYQLIPLVFEVRSRGLGLPESDRRDWARVRSSALIGFAGAFGALGGMGINVVLRQSYELAGTATPALWIFTLSYVVAAFLAWARYVRPRLGLLVTAAADADHGVVAPAGQDS